MSEFQVERDSIAFLGLLAIANKRFDAQYTHADSERTHTNGLNIFACILDNTDGQVLAVEQNRIHAEVDPMQHAEQRTLKNAIAAVRLKRPLDPTRTSVEGWYRNQLFNDGVSTDPLNAGCTIYTTLEPCPFCTSALLVTRMKRIVFLIPDAVYGGTYPYLKTPRYAKYDMHYGQLDIRLAEKNAVVKAAVGSYSDLLGRVASIKAQEKPPPDTLLLDHMTDFLAMVRTTFLAFKATDLTTTGTERTKNERTLADLQRHA